MAFDVQAWLRQATTGAGGSLILGTVTALSTGQVTFAHALPALVTGVFLVFFPEKNASAALVAPVVTDVEKAVEAYNLGRKHGSVENAIAAAVPAAPTIQDALKLLLAVAGNSAVPVAESTANTTVGVVAPTVTTHQSS